MKWKDLGRIDEGENFEIQIELRENYFENLGFFNFYGILKAPGL